MNLLHRVRVADVLDMALVAALVYALLVWFKRTKTAFVAMGLLLLAVVYSFAYITGMYMTVAIFRGFFAVLIIAIIVIFQEELRSVFERIAVWSLRGGGVEAEPSVQEVVTVVRSLGDLAHDRIGALLVLRGHDPLDRHIEGGWDLHGELSEALIKSIFDSHSLGHDGAIVIENDRVTRFGCRLPLSKDFTKTTNLGTRHMAALGLAERTDALCVIVSEERGTISIAHNSQLKVVGTLEELETAVEAFLARLMPGTPKGIIPRFLHHNAREKALALGISALLRLFFMKIFGS